MPHQNWFKEEPRDGLQEIDKWRNVRLADAMKEIRRVTEKKMIEDAAALGESYKSAT